ncbi:hypothetical protein [uncultured Brevundimonas sp.]|uniref:hypothetical protein n=1 Tax=uncultured Brevundimonas sp. TaxID=213418 RepID=UPI002610FFA2|nr:hypothetical protein [uncultured Brevundimonas sp.]
MRIVLFATLATSLAACASGAGPGGYAAELERLAADCEARGGVLAPTGSQSGRPQLDHVCKIAGQPPRR